MARLQAVGQAKPGQSHGLTMALAWPKILESQSHWLRPRLSSEFLDHEGVSGEQFPKNILNNSQFGNLLLNFSQTEISLHDRGCQLCNFEASCICATNNAIHHTII
jgi:hypothetical protein